MTMTKYLYIVRNDTNKKEDHFLYKRLVGVIEGGLQINFVKKTLLWLERWGVFFFISDHKKVKP